MKRESWIAGSLLLTGLITLTGCQPTPVTPTELKGQVTELSAQYVAAPRAPGIGELVYEEGSYLVVSENHRVFEVQLWDESLTFPPATRIDKILSPYKAIDGVIQGPPSLFALISISEGLAPIAIFSEGYVSDVWSAMDYARVQFEDWGEYWVGASYGTTVKSELGVSEIERRSWRLKPDFQATIDLVPGATGRLGILHPRFEEQAKPSQIIDPVEQIVLPQVLKFPPDLDRDELIFWVDQGHLFGEVSGKILDYGPIKTVVPMRAADDASRFSPWSIERKNERKQLVVKNIYDPSLSYVLERPGRTWTQEAAPFGLHALYDDGDIYDLRTGKLALTITFAPDDSGEFIIIAPDGTVSGSRKMLEQRGLLKRANATKINALLADLLRLRTSEAEARFQAEVEKRNDQAAIDQLNQS